MNRSSINAWQTVALGIVVQVLAACGAEHPIDSIGKEVSEGSGDFISRNLAAADSFKLLARIEAQAGELVEFYEPKPGLIFVGVAASAEVKPVTSEELRLKPEELWHFVSRGAAMPEALRDAFRRRDELRAARGDTAATQQQLGSLPGLPKSSSQSSYSAFNSPCWEYYTCGTWYHYRVYNNDATGSYGTSHGDAVLGHSAVCNKLGVNPILFDVQSDEPGEINGGTGVFEITPGSWYSVSWNDSNCDVWPWEDCPWIQTNGHAQPGSTFRYRFCTDGDT